MQTSKGLIFLVITIFVLNVLYIETPLGAQNTVSEQQLIEDILSLDAKVLALKNEVEKLSNKNSELERSLHCSIATFLRNRKNWLSGLFFPLRAAQETCLQFCWELKI